MAVSEWLRTFVAVYRSGSVSGGAAAAEPVTAGGQPAAGRARATGRPTPLRADPPRGRADPPGARAARPGGRVARPAGTRPGRDRRRGGHPRSTTVRFGSSAEFFSYAVVPRLGAEAPALSARFGSDDVAPRSARTRGARPRGDQHHPGRRSLTSTPIGAKRFVLVGPPALAPVQPFASLDRTRIVAGRQTLGGLQRRAAPDPSVLALRPRPSLRRRPAPGRSRSAGRGRRGGPGTGHQPAPRLRLCRSAGARVGGRGASGGGRRSRSSPGSPAPGWPTWAATTSTGLSGASRSPATDDPTRRDPVHAGSCGSPGHAGHRPAVFEIESGSGGQHPPDPPPHRAAQQRPGLARADPAVSR